VPSPFEALQIALKAFWMIKPPHAIDIDLECVSEAECRPVVIATREVALSRPRLIVDGVEVIVRPHLAEDVKRGFILGLDEVEIVDLEEPGDVVLALDAFGTMIQELKKELVNSTKDVVKKVAESIDKISEQKDDEKRRVKEFNDRFNKVEKKKDSLIEEFYNAVHELTEIRNEARKHGLDKTAKVIQDALHEMDKASVEIDTTFKVCRNRMLDYIHMKELGPAAKVMKELFPEVVEKAKKAIEVTHNEFKKIYTTLTTEAMTKVIKEPEKRRIIEDFVRDVHGRLIKAYDALTAKTKDLHEATKDIFETVRKHVRDFMDKVVAEVDKYMKHTSEAIEKLEDVKDRLEKAYTYVKTEQLKEYQGVKTDLNTVLKKVSEILKVT